MIYYIGYFLLFFVFLRFIISLMNFVNALYLYNNINLENNPKISILIPARNEESNIKLLLSDILGLSYDNYEVLIYDDCSTDNTKQVVKNYMHIDNRIRLIEGKVLDEGWLGKNFACYNLALQASGNYLLFLDADVRIGRNLIERAIFTIIKQDLKLLSVFPKQIIDNKGTLQVIPLMNWILLSLLPLILVRISKRTSLSAANGQFMLFEAKTYRELHPHYKFKDSKVEDIAICRYYKKNKMPVATVLGDDDILCKMYNTKQEAIEGFSKNIFAFFGDSVIVTILFALVTSLSPLYLLFFVSTKLTLIYILFIILIRVFISIACKQNVVKNLMYMLLQHYSFLQIIYKALVHRKNKSLVWKERKIE